MFKSMSDNAHYLERTGSHSTKEKRTGRIDMIPPWAKEPEEYYTAIRDRYLSINNQMQDCQKQLSEINERLRLTLPSKEYQHWKGIKDSLSEKFCSLQAIATEYRALTRAAGEQSWLSVFYECAKIGIDTKILIALEEEVKAILERNKFEIKKGEGEVSPEQREIIRAKARRKDRRSKFRKNYFTGNRLVHSD